MVLKKINQKILKYPQSVGNNIFMYMSLLSKLQYIETETYISIVKF